MIHSYTVTLQKSGGDSPNKLRTQTVRGLTTDLPCPGQSFAMYSEPLDKSMTTRLVTTSPATYVNFTSENGKIVRAFFKTKSGSEYQLDIHEIHDIETVSAEDLPEARA